MIGDLKNSLELKRKKLKDFVLFSLLISVSLLFSFTPLGSIQIGPVSILLAHLPFILSIFILDDKYVISNGFIFATLRLIKNTISINPVASFWFSPFVPVIGTDEASLWALLINYLPVFLMLALYFFTKKYKGPDGKYLPKLYEILMPAVYSLINTVSVLSSVYLIYADRLKSYFPAFTSLMMAFLFIAFTNGLLEALMASLVIPKLTKYINLYR